MKSFFEFSLMLEADPLGGISTPASLPGAGGPPPGPGGPMGAPPMGGPPGGGPMGAPPMGGLPGGPMGAPPMGGMGGAPGGNQPALKLKATNVWEALEKYFYGDKEEKDDIPVSPSMPQAQVPQAQAPQQTPAAPADQSQMQMPQMGGM